MYGITDPLTFLVGTIFIVLLPGPNSMFVLTVASLRGITSGYRAALGVFAGDSILMFLAAMGAASVLYANPTLFMILKYAGAAYLGYIGLGLIRAAWLHWRDPRLTAARVKDDHDYAMKTSRTLTDTAGRSPGRTVERPFRRALLVSLINPKAIFFFLSFFVQFVDTSYTYPALTFLLLGAIVQMCSFIYLSLLIVAGSKLAHLMRSHPRLNCAASAGVGALFIAFGLRLADASIKGL